MRAIEFYRLESGRSPIEEFLDSLNAKQARKITWVMGLVEEFERVPSQYLQKMENTDDLWEIRVQFGGNIFRFLGFFVGGKLFLVAHGFAKKAKKTHQQDIDLAESRKREYQTRKGVKKWVI